MKNRSLSLTIALVASLFAFNSSANADTLLAKDGFTHANCTWSVIEHRTWTYPYGYGSNTKKGLKCQGSLGNGASFVAIKASYSLNGSVQDCSVSLTDETSSAATHRLTGRDCDTYQLYSYASASASYSSQSACDAALSGKYIGMVDPSNNAARKALQNKAEKTCGACGITYTSQGYGTSLTYYCK